MPMFSVNEANASLNLLIEQVRGLLNGTLRQEDVSNWMVEVCEVQTAREKV